MTLKLFELVGKDPARPFSPYCWRTRLALAHKGLSAETIPWRFTEKSAIAPYNAERVPVLLDGDRAIADSWEIARYLEQTYSGQPSLFGGAGGKAATRFLNGWGDAIVIRGILPLILVDVVPLLDPVDQEYFRRTREARFSRRLEEVSADRDSKVDGFRASLEPVRMMLGTQPFIGGQAPNYGDYIVFGAFQWARAVSPFRLLTEDDPVYAWREKMLDLFDGLARKSPGYAV